MRKNVGGWEFDFYQSINNAYRSAIVTVKYF